MLDICGWILVPVNLASSTFRTQKIAEQTSPRTTRQINITKRGSTMSASEASAVGFAYSSALELISAK